MQVQQLGVGMAEGVDVVGLLNGESGIGEAGRLIIRALRAVNYPVSALKVTTPAHRDAYPFDTEDEWKNDKCIISINSPELPMYLRQLRWDQHGHKYTIGQWFWEIEKVPPFFHIGYSYVNEVWAPSKFITDAFSKSAPPNVKVQQMPIPLLPPPVKEGITKTNLKISEDRFVFLFTFSFHSTMGRKNPMGTIKAFKEAFAENEGPVLIIKSINAESYPSYHNAMVYSAENRSDIMFINNHVDHDVNGALLNLADCYVSLHRSEGLGLTISESMSLGKPVITTAYGGNMDFCNDSNSILIPWKPTEVGSGVEPYPATYVWAEPDVYAAAEAMRHVHLHQNEAKKMGENAKKMIKDNYSLEVTGKKMVDYLKSLDVAPN